MSVQLRMIDIVHHANGPAGAGSASEHIHPYYELIYLVRGRYQTEVGGKTVECGQGQLICYSPLQPHRARFFGLRGSGGRGESILLQWTQTAQNGDPPAYPLHFVDHDGRLFAALNWMLELHRGGGPADAQALEHLMAAFLHELARSGDRGRFLLQSVRTYIEDNLTGRLRVDHLAEAVGLSKFHLMREFKKLTGTPLMRFVVHLRVERARALLADRTLRLADIARRVGLSSAFHLSHRFKREFGVSPRAYRAGQAPVGPARESRRKSH